MPGRLSLAPSLGRIEGAYPAKCAAEPHSHIQGFSYQIAEVVAPSRQALVALKFIQQLSASPHLEPAYANLLEPSYPSSSLLKLHNGRVTRVAVGHPNSKPREEGERFDNPQLPMCLAEARM